MVPKAQYRLHGTRCRQISRSRRYARLPRRRDYLPGSAAGHFLTKFTCCMPRAPGTFGTSRDIRLEWSAVFGDFFILRTARDCAILTIAQSRIYLALRRATEKRPCAQMVGPSSRSPGSAVNARSLAPGSLETASGSPYGKRKFQICRNRAVPRSPGVCATCTLPALQSERLRRLNQSSMHDVRSFECPVCHTILRLVVHGGTRRCSKRGPSLGPRPPNITGDPVFAWIECLAQIPHNDGNSSKFIIASARLS